MPEDRHPPERIKFGQRPALQPRTRALLTAIARVLRSVSPEDPETDILLHDMARQIEARLDGDESAGAGLPRTPR